ncbi:hypothetical protein T440DRAFT_537411 [Plenodomus tracheiphilus IPT5]|uniref:Uncharacterized protein n=1 Tax=Plenodomus tracheiphilus IPT5 TaxID=1408161 RepID=A0A6A7B0Y1_9PLEO|nr:hypothetical protein T440DRAFT_537411 [Plenodomus tracheiphilus IPT5]
MLRRPSVAQQKGSGRRAAGGRWAATARAKGETRWGACSGAKKQQNRTGTQARSVRAEQTDRQTDRHRRAAAPSPRGAASALSTSPLPCAQKVGDWPWHPRASTEHCEHSVVERCRGPASPAALTRTSHMHQRTSEPANHAAGAFEKLPKAVVVRTRSTPGLPRAYVLRAGTWHLAPGRAVPCLSTPRGWPRRDCCCVQLSNEPGRSMLASLPLHGKSRRGCVEALTGLRAQASPTPTALAHSNQSLHWRPPAPPPVVDNYANHGRSPPASGASAT